MNLHTKHLLASYLYKSTCWAIGDNISCKLIELFLACTGLTNKKKFNFTDNTIDKIRIIAPGTTLGDLTKDDFDNLVKDDALNIGLSWVNFLPIKNIDYIFTGHALPAYMAVESGHKTIFAVRKSRFNKINNTYSLIRNKKKDFSIEYLLSSGSLNTPEKTKAIDNAILFALTFKPRIIELVGFAPDLSGYAFLSKINLDKSRKFFYEKGCNKLAGLDNWVIGLTSVGGDVNSNDKLGNNNLSFEQCFIQKKQSYLNSYDTTKYIMKNANVHFEAKFCSKSINEIILSIN